MKKQMYLITLLVSAFFITGYQKINAQQSTEQNKATATEKVKEAGVAVRDYTYSQKEEFITKTKTELNDLKKELADLEIKAKQTTGTAKAEAAKKIQDVKVSINKLNGQLETIKAATESQWNELKNKFNKSMDSAKASIAKSRKWLSEKIAP
jgi:hypothetical protein